jgi:prepilin-type N-terminal cleavage/methylation domain-containing protein
MDRTYLPSSAKQAFSLVELSIVLVILGLLIGGILSGQSLIRASELRAVTTESMRYTAAVQTFRDKYFAIPGDFSKATSFWGDQGAGGCIDNSATASVSTGTCDGDGNGYVYTNAGAGNTAELFQFWRQLAFAGLIEGTYTGVAGPGGGEDTLVGTNAPKSKLNNGGWTAYSITSNFGDTQTYTYTYGNLFELGSYVGTSRTYGALLKPEELWNIDTKLDDGKPGTGTLIARESMNWNGTAGTKCTTSTSNIDYAGLYNLSNSGVSCAAYFKEAF